MIPQSALQQLSRSDAWMRKQGLREIVSHGAPQELSQLYNQLQPQIAHAWGMLDDEEKSLYVAMHQVASGQQVGAPLLADQIQSQHKKEVARQTEQLMQRRILWSLGGTAIVIALWAVRNRYH